MLDWLAMLLYKGAEMIGALENAPRVRRLVWGALAVAGVFALAALLQGVGAVRWW